MPQKSNSIRKSSAQVLVNLSMRMWHLLESILNSKLCVLISVVPFCIILNVLVVKLSDLLRCVVS